MIIVASTLTGVPVGVNVEVPTTTVVQPMPIPCVQAEPDSPVPCVGFDDSVRPGPSPLVQPASPVTDPNVIFPSKCNVDEWRL
jgi:hypothetical protein